ncbi:glycosyltransferase family 2 protein [Cellulomonas triticagri]|uniref:Glycosyltransferase family 2 protein n=1 Tax=Cellulomonas triticagri TaxID=2483352 RepID=A0A3M2JAD8_9CELL|nr:glycosyltransferase family 2 protein [Cellulomonas triticagri]RMI08770.1 glycosyltransferase family 2 protein [Cellulomonas triticagri]
MTRLLPPLSPVGWLLFAAMVVLVLTYLYFWWNVVRATAHGHVSRERITDADLVAARTEAEHAGRTHRFLVQVTTKGGALPVVLRGIDEVLAGVARYPALRDVVRVEVVTEDATEVEALTRRYRRAAVPVAAFLLPVDYTTPKGTRLKARALEYMVEQHRADPDDCYVVHFDEESVLTPDNLARLVHRLTRHPVGISEGMISYGLDWDQATLLNKAMESSRPFGCHECYSVMTSPPPMHLHGSNLVIRQDLENAIGWDIGTLDGAALIAEDLVFGLAAYVKFGPDVFGWHHTEMIEQPPFTLRAAYKQRERWVFGSLQALAHVEAQPDWTRLSRRDRWQISVVIRLRVLTYALGFAVSLLALGSNAVVLGVLGTRAVAEGGLDLAAPELSVYGALTTAGLLLWLGSNQLGLFYNLRYSGLTRLQKARDHVLVLLATPFAGVVDTAGPLVAVLKWTAGIREVAWKPTPKRAPGTAPALPTQRTAPAVEVVGALSEVAS